MDGSRSGALESRYDVTLVSAGGKPQRAARIIGEFTDRTRQEAMGMIETAPVLILRGAGYATAEGARMALERLGAEVEVRAYEVETARPPQSSARPTKMETALRIVGWGILTLFFIFIILVVIVSLILANLGDPTF
jgi:hypothetical protein